MDVGLHDGGIDAELGTVLEAEPDRGVHHSAVEGADRGGRQAAEGAVEKASCLGTGWPSKVVKSRSE